MISRRNFVTGTAVTALGLAGGLPAYAQDAKRSSSPLKIPALLDGTAAGDARVFDLTTMAGKSEFLPGVSTPTLGINGAHLGPTIRCRSGERVTLRVKNTLSETTALHWHGLIIPAKYDGGPHQVVEPGTTWEPSFEIRQNASLCWYHSHAMGRTGEQVLQGLAGLFLIDDDESRALGLPSEYGVDDIPLVIQDRRFKRDGSFDYLSSMPDVMMGYRGNYILVNGTVDPYFMVRRQRTRLRVLNGSNARIYNLGREDGADLVLIGSDGSLLERPVRQRRVRLGPGERAELLVDIQPGATLKLMSYPDQVAGGRGMMGMASNAETFPVIELRTAQTETSNLSLPERLIAVPRWQAAQARRTRTFTLDMGMMGMGGMMRGGGMSGAMGINGRSMNPSRIDEQVPAGSVEIWEIRNATPLAHPFHIHAVQFRVLDRDGQLSLPAEQGLKDTVLVDPGSTVRVITQFPQFVDAAHPYMYHCHILEHEDAGMMGQYTVV